MALYVVSTVIFWSGLALYLMAPNYDRDQRAFGIVFMLSAMGLLGVKIFI